MTSARNVCNWDVPRYLFKIDAPGLVGPNRGSLFTSAVWNNGDRYSTYDQLNRFGAERVMADHIRWLRHNQPVCSTFTSSLLYALQLATYSIATDRGCLTSPYNCFITVIDTHRLPSGTFKSVHSFLQDDKWAPLSARFLEHEYYSSEYLAQSVLHLPSSAGKTVSYQQLVQAGLLEYLELLNDSFYSRQVAETLHLYRVTNYQDEPLSPTDINEMVIAGALACCFDGPFCIPMMVWFLALKRRSHLDPTIVDFFHDGLTIEKPFVFEDRQAIIPEVLSELRQFDRLMNMIFDMQNGPMVLPPGPDQDAEATHAPLTAQAAVQTRPGNEFEHPPLFVL